MGLPRYLEKFESSDGAITVSFPPEEYEYESEQPLGLAYTRVAGASYSYDHLGSAVAPRLNAAERVRFIYIGDATGLDIDADCDALRYALHAAGRGKLWTLDANGDRRWAWGRAVDLPTMTLRAGEEILRPVVCGFTRQSDWYGSGFGGEDQQRHYMIDLGFDGDSFVVYNGEADVYNVTMRLRAEANYRVTAGSTTRDASRRLGNASDGWPYALNGSQSGGVVTRKSTIGIYRGNTNLIANGGFETNATGWGAGGTNTIVRDAADTGKFGDRAGLCTYSNNVTLAFHAVTLTAARYTGSLWVKIPTSYSGGGLTLGLANLAGSGSAVNGTADMGLRDQWQRLACSIVPVGGDLAGDLVLLNTGATPDVSDTVQIDGAQVELGAYPTPYVHTDGATAGRTAPEVVGKIAGGGDHFLNSTQSWVAARIQTNQTDDELATAGLFNCLFDWVQDVNNGIRLYMDTSTKRWSTEVEDGTGSQFLAFSSVQDFAAKTDLTLIFAWTATQLKISVNGAAFETVTRTRFPVISATTYSVGKFNTAAGWSDFDFHWFTSGSGDLSDADAATIHAFGNTDPAVGQLPAEAISVWSCDGIGISTATDQFNDPAIENLTTGYSISANRTAPDANAEWKVDAGAGTVEYSSDDGSSYTDDMANATRGGNKVALMKLQPGANVFEYGDVGGIGGVDSVLEVIFYPAYL